jgi:hypothetical protein
MEKELIQESLFKDYTPEGNTTKNSEIPYNILLTNFVDPGEIKDTLFIDAVSPLPEGFPDISEYLKSLGTQLIDVRGKTNEIEVIFEGGKVVYYKEYNLKTREYGQYQIGEIVIYGVTTEPGVRAIRTSKLDTHIFFNTHDDKYLSYYREDDSLYKMKNGEVLRVTISEPEYIDIKDTWVK